MTTDQHLEQHQDHHDGEHTHREILVHLRGNAFWRTGDLHATATDTETDLDVVITETDEWGPSWAEIILTHRPGDTPLTEGQMSLREQPERTTYRLMLLPGSYDRREVCNADGGWEEVWRRAPGSDAYEFPWGGDC